MLGTGMVFVNVHNSLQKQKYEDNQPNCCCKHGVFDVSFTDITRSNGGGVFVCF